MWLGTGRRCASRLPRRRFLCAERRDEGNKAGLTFSRYEVYEEKIREVCRLKGLLAYAATAREYVRLI